jgi:hypothetical protein
MENINFNLFTSQIVDYELNSDNYTFDNAPETMDGAFRFYTSITRASAILQQTIIMNSSNIVYTREYDQNNTLFSAWITPGGSTPVIKKGYVITTDGNKSLAVLLSSQIPPITDAIGNQYVINNTVGTSIDITASYVLGNNSFLGVSPTSITIPGNGVLVVLTLVADTSYQIITLSATYNVANGIVTTSGSNKLAVGIIPTAIPATSIANGSVSNAQFQYISGATSNIQAQINALPTPIDYVDGDNIKITGNVIAVVDVNPVVTTLSADGTIPLGEALSPQIILADTANITLSLPNAVNATDGVEYTVKALATPITIDTSVGGQLVDGDVGVTLNTLYSSVTVYAHLGNWYIKCFYGS